MALQMTLEAKYNHMAIDFKDAYWQLQGLQYDTEFVYLRLQAYPNREACHKGGEFITEHLPVGGPEHSTFEPQLYCWEGLGTIIDIFPDGIPLDVNAQKAAVYNWIKEYTGLPFEDVFE